MNRMTITELDEKQLDKLLLTSAHKYSELNSQNINKLFIQKVSKFKSIKHIKSIIYNIVKYIALAISFVLVFRLTPSALISYCLGK